MLSVSCPTSLCASSLLPSISGNWLFLLLGPHGRAWPAGLSSSPVLRFSHPKGLTSYSRSRARIPGSELGSRRSFQKEDKSPRNGRRLGSQIVKGSRLYTEATGSHGRFGGQSMINIRKMHSVLGRKGRQGDQWRPLQMSRGEARRTCIRRNKAGRKGEGRRKRWGMRDRTGAG